MRKSYAIPKLRAKNGYALIISLVGILIAVGVISGALFVSSIKPISSHQTCQSTVTTQITDAINKTLIPPPDRYFEIDQVKVNRECQWAIVTMTPKDMLGRPLGDPFLKSARSSEGEWEVILSENPVYGLWLQLINYLNNLLVRTSRSPDSIQPISTPDASRESTRSTTSTTQVIAGDTSNWKTYTNQEHTFSFRHPEKLDVFISDEKSSISSKILGNSQALLQTYMFLHNYDLGSSFPPNIFVYSNPNQSPLDKWTDLFITNGIYEPYNPYESVEDFSFNDMAAKKVSIFRIDSSDVGYIVANNNSIYLLTCPDSDPTREETAESNKTCHQILSTFKFVE